MKEISAGITAGMIAGVLYPTIQYLVSFLASGGKLTFVYEATLFSQLDWVRQLGLTVEMVLFLILLGYALFSGVCGGVGLILGIVFAKLSDKFAIRSIYLRILGWGIIFYVVAFLLQFTTSRTFVDVYTLIAIIIDSSIFSVLYHRWTKPFTGSTQKIPTTRAS